MTTYKDFDIYKLSHKLDVEIHKMTLNEDYDMTNQMRRAAISVPSNISEGAARQTKKEFIQFLHMAQGSLSELDTQLEIAIRLGYFKEDHFSEVSLLTNNIDKMLTGLIKSLRR